MKLQSEIKPQDFLSEKRIYFPELDGLRFFAFLLVFFQHRGTFSMPAFSFFHEIGWIGVDLFFTLSAFLFTKLLVAEYEKTNTISIRKFYLRRIFRIWPLYFFIIAISVWFWVYIDKAQFTNLERTRLIGLLTFTDNIACVSHYYNHLPFVGLLWTISYEEQFYLLIPFIILLFVKVNTTKKIILFVIAYLLLTGMKLMIISKGLNFPAIWVLPVSHFESVLFGIVIGFGGFDFIAKRVKPIIIIFFSFLFFYLYTQSTSIYAQTPGLIQSYLLIGLATSFVLLAVINSTYLKTILSHPILVFLGKRSYGLYVYHELVNHLILMGVRHFPHLPYTPVITFWVSLCLTTIMAILSYVLIETPFLKLKKRFEIVKSRPI